VLWQSGEHHKQQHMLALWQVAAQVVKDMTLQPAVHRRCREYGMVWHAVLRSIHLAKLKLLVGAAIIM
jgi:hypothetical protein